ncbi:MAG TPA: hypothetical protein ENK24_00300, partial [Anaerolineae bacterium]|nr:hypothetical protein [Anaerolineae bacterium]
VRLLNQAAVSAATFDDAHPQPGAPLAAWEASHPVDALAPEFVGLAAPEYLLAAGQNRLSGYAFDDSGISAVTLQLQPGGALLNCPDNQPDDGQWACDWDLSGAADGDTFNVQLRAADTFGQAGEWADWGALMVDAQPPTVNLSLDSARAISGAILTADSLPALAGTIADNGGIAALEGCFEGDCAPASLQLDAPSPQRVDDAPAAPIALSNAQACGGGEVVRTFTVSNAMTIGQIAFGLTVDYTRRNNLQATLESPQGTSARLLYPVDTDRVLENYDVALLDATAQRYNDGNGDNTAAPYFDRVARPDQPLSRFRGENAAGTWTLRLCDVGGAPAAGSYYRSRLTVYPVNSAAQSGNWSFTLPSLGQLDYATKTVSFIAEDVVGNRSAPLDATFTVDNVPPTLTATLLTAANPLTFTVPALAGAASDGGAVSNVYVTVQTPAGRVYAERVELTGGNWQYDLRPMMPGKYTLWARAGDLAGNIAEIAPFEVDITSPSTLYLPIIMRNYTPPVVAPDLVVSSITANAGQLQVIIRNDGNAPAENAFWVDAYINPTTVPTAVNQIWQNMGDEGAAWGVEGKVLPLAPGETLTLTVQGTATQTVGDAYFWAEYSRINWALANGTPVYAQVDSANANTDYGNVLENHEIEGRAYNNIAGPVFSLENLPRNPLPSGVANPSLGQNALPPRAEAVAAPPPEMPFKLWLPLVLKEGGE